MRKKFVTYEEYSTATLDDIFSKEQISESPKRITNFLETVWFENIDGKFNSVCFEKLNEDWAL